MQILSRTYKQATTLAMARASKEQQRAEINKALRQSGGGTMAKEFNHLRHNHSRTTSQLLVLRELAFRVASWLSKWHADVSPDVLRTEPFKCKMLTISVPTSRDRVCKNIGPSMTLGAPPLDSSSGMGRQGSNSCRPTVADLKVISKSRGSTTGKTTCKVPTQRLSVDGFSTKNTQA